ncbi:AAA family ATPase [Bacteroides heparinolyticus]|uniref:AAA family ATPase n=1 Tax=Prevotella heparinolytica TaxID=28113 RepID=UPI0040394B2E
MKCEWILCPVCGSKTRNKIRKDTVLENYPLYCPKCRQASHNVGKTTTAVNLGIGLAAEGNKVLLIDGDPQGSMTICLGYREPDRLEYTLSTLLSEVMEEKKLSLTQTIIQHDEGVDLIPANIELSALEINLVNAMSREVMLRSIVEYLKAEYDYKYIIIDCIESIHRVTIDRAVERKMKSTI